MDERKRRELAEAHKDEIDIDSGRAVTPKRLDTIVSLRLPSDLAVELRYIADRAGINVSDLLRAAARQLVAGEPIAPPRRPAGWHCQHMSITSSAGVLGKVSLACGCDMQPIY